MRVKSSLGGLLLIGAVVLTACGAPAQEKPMAKPEAPTAMPTPTVEAMMKKEVPAADAMAKPAEDKMMDKAATPEAMKKEMPAADAMAKPAEGAMADKAAAMVAMPAWFTTRLTDVTTGKVFTVGGLEGKTILVENMAIWCSTCLSQQREVQALHKTLGERADLVSLTLDIDPNERADALKAYVAKNSFGGLYAVAPADTAREIGLQLGNQFLNPPSAPMFVIDRHGQVHALPFGVKTAQALADALKPYLDEKM